MKYKIEVERITPPLEGEKYDQTETIYRQIFEEDSDRESTRLNRIIDAVNKYYDQN